MSVIYIVQACTSYEGNSLLHAFAELADAEDFRATCESYQATKPASPTECVDTPESNVEHAAWWADHEAWVAKHPGGLDAAFCSYFNVCSLSFATSAKGSGEEA